MKFHCSLFCLLLLPIWIKCISPLEIESDVEQGTLMVEGFITNDIGPYEIRLSRIAKFAGTRFGGQITPVEEAEVYHEDEERMDLKEVVVEGELRVLLVFKKKAPSLLQT